MYWCWPYPHNDFCQHRGNTTSKLGPHRLASSRCHCGGCWLVKSQTKGLTGIFGYDQLAKGIFHPKAKSWPSICCRPWRAKQNRAADAAAGCDSRQQLVFKECSTHFTEHKLNLRQKVWLAILVMSPKGYVIPRLKAGHHSVIQSLYLYLLWSVTGKTGQLVLIAVWHQIILRNDRWVHRLVSLDTQVQTRWVTT